MNTIETIEELLYEFDQLLDRRARRYARLNNIYCKNGQIPASEYLDYKREKKAIIAEFEKKAIFLQEALDKTCKRIRKRQPDIVHLSKQYMNLRYSIPRKLVFGRIHAEYADKWDAMLPKAIPFPIKKPLYIKDMPEQWEMVHKLYLRLLYALPLGKTEFFIYDPVQLGYSVRKFTRLFSHPEVSPPGKVMTTIDELKTQLQKTLQYAEDMIQNRFSFECDCWEDYNRFLYSQGQGAAELPYKIFTFFSFPSDLDEAAMEMIRKLVTHSERCGFLIVFVICENEIVSDDKLANHRRDITLAQELKGKSASLVRIHQQLSGLSELHHLTITERSEPFPNDACLVNILKQYLEQLEASKSIGTEMDKIYSIRQVFDRCSAKELCIPIGFSDADRSVVEIHIGDETPHYLVGGTTGSGKSNLLHIIIQSACVHYSPFELNVYLLDFKEGVEFSAYADPTLPHARLVATEADAEYGVTVLRHLDKERERRYAVFKKYNVKDLCQYRKQHPEDNNMPRILLIIDEFQVLFSKDSKSDVAEYFESLAKQGRACGIHMILSTQTLKNLDFSMLGTQFGGRIALRCVSSEDSRNLLGASISSSNDAAVDIKIPYAIINTDGGMESANIKTYIPEASQNREIITALHREGYRRGMAVQTKIYSGNLLPQIPEQQMESDETLILRLGKVLDYENEPFVLRMEPRVGCNLIVCGSNQRLMHGIMRSITLCVAYNRAFCEILIVGKHCAAFDQTEKDVRYFETLKDFLTFIDTADFYTKHRVVMFNEANPAKDVSYSSSYIPANNKEAMLLKAFFEESAEKGTTILAFYERFESLKASALPLSCFEYRIGFELSVDTLFKLAETNYMGGIKKIFPNRAYSLHNGEIDACFLPYVENGK